MVKTERYNQEQHLTALGDYPRLRVRNHYQSFRGFTSQGWREGPPSGFQREDPLSMTEGVILLPGLQRKCSLSRTERVRLLLGFQRKGPLSREDGGSRFQRESPLTRDGEVEQLPEFQREDPLPKAEGDESTNQSSKGIVPRQMGWDHYQCSRGVVCYSRLKGMDQYQNLRERFHCSGVRVCGDF